MTTLNFCSDCFTLEIAGDVTFLDFNRTEDEVLEHIDRFERGMLEIMQENPGLKHFADTGEIEEHSTARCDCCKSTLAGKRHQVTMIF